MMSQEVHPQVLPASADDFPQIILMDTLFLGLHNYVIYIVLDEIMEDIMKNDSYGALLGCTSGFLDRTA